jgi:hypothetical protein
VHPARLVSLCAVFALGPVSSCGTSDYGDQPSDPFIPAPSGKGNRIYQIANPASPTKAASQDTVAVTGAVVVAVDTFDETGDGKSSGTIYVADLGSKEPYSGISLYNPSFVPPSLQISAGDTLDLRGTYQENQDLPVKFAPKAFLVQISNPVATFQFDAKVPDPVDVDVRDLQEYDRGRRWLNMIVRLKDVTLQRDANKPGGRVSAGLLPETGSGLSCKANTDCPANAPTCDKFHCKAACSDPFPKAPVLVNELMDLSTVPQLTQGTVIKELVGVVTYFCSLHVAPRTAADITF